MNTLEPPTPRAPTQQEPSRVPIGDVLRIHYGKSLRKEERNETGKVQVFGSSGYIGNHDTFLTDQATLIIGRKGSVGSITYSPNPSWTIDTAFYTEAINPSEVCLRYLFHALSNAKLDQHAITTSIPGLSRDDIYKTKIPLPPLETQKQIAAILDAADALRAKRRESLRKLDELLKSVFLEMFGDPVENPRGWEERRLDSISDIVSGVTKGRKFNGQRTVEVPYMRVANVQDGHIVLDEVKNIEVLPSDVEKYRLEVGDILLTEGGDPDKLGRGAIWEGQIQDCIHQNHIFRVRVTSDDILAEFLSPLISSQRGKRYFLSAAKQTTGIASINMTQLRGFSVLIPPLDLQIQYKKVAEKLSAKRRRLEQSLSYLEALFASLQQRAFG